MIALRISSSRSGYRRGGLVFAEPKARRITAGRLAIDLTVAELMALGAANLAELRRDPAIRFEAVSPAAVDHAVYRARQMAHQARVPHTPIRVFSGMEQRSARLAHNQEVGGSNPPPASTFQTPRPRARSHEPRAPGEEAAKAAGKAGAAPTAPAAKPTARKPRSKAVK